MITAVNLPTLEFRYLHKKTFGFFVHAFTFSGVCAFEDASDLL